MPFFDVIPKPIRTTRWNPVPAVYGLLDVHRRLIYVGQTDDLARRIGEHLTAPTSLISAFGAAFVVADVVHSSTERALREAQLIAEYQPACNQQLR
jgi:excinuclease UvrABC nuclease subunit